MYDFYPEWGPARHSADDERPVQRRPRYWQSSHRRTPVMAGGPEARDTESDRPDDN